MRPLGPATRPGQPQTPVDLRPKKKKWFGGTSKSKRGKDRKEPPVLSAPVAPQELPAPKKPGMFARIKSLFSRVPAPKLSLKRSAPDPAPSRFKYIWGRMMLRPKTRLAILKGVPTFVILGVVGLLMTNDGLRQDISSTYNQLREDIIKRPELYVQVMQVTGATPRVDQQIRLSSGLDLPTSSFEMDLVALRARLERLDAVKSVSVYLRAGGVLQVDVEERTPVVLWRSPTGLETVDIDGIRTGYVERRSAYPALPLVVGNGAKSNIPEVLHLLREARPLAPDIRAFRRVGERRWDVILTNNAVIKLPQEKPGRALAYVMALHTENDLLVKNISAIDLRDANRPIVRVAEKQPEAEAVYVNSVLTPSEE